MKSKKKNNKLIFLLIAQFFNKLFYVILFIFLCLEIIHLQELGYSLSSVWKLLEFNYLKPIADLTKIPVIEEPLVNVPTITVVEKEPIVEISKPRVINDTPLLEKVAITVVIVFYGSFACVMVYMVIDAIIR